MRVLVVVDMQNDFVTGSLGTKEAQAIVSKVKSKIEEYEQSHDLILFTQDTHDFRYMMTQEGRNLPVEHCIKGTDGWKIIDELCYDSIPYEKNTFGSLQLAQELKEENGMLHIEQIELIGVCTGICVLSNAALLKAALPEIPIVVDASCCACVTPETHKTALNAMKLLQIKVVNE